MHTNTHTQICLIPECCSSLIQFTATITETRLSAKCERLCCCDSRLPDGSFIDHTFKNLPLCSDLFKGKVNKRVNSSLKTHNSKASSQQTCPDNKKPDSFKALLRYWYDYCWHCWDGCININHCVDILSYWLWLSLCVRKTSQKSQKSAMNAPLKKSLPPFWCSTPI